MQRVLRTLSLAGPVFLLLLGLPAAVRGQFDITTNNGVITITGYTGPGGPVIIPSTTNDLPVTRVGIFAFYGSTSVTSITIPSCVTNIGDWAFSSCTSLAEISVDELNPVYGSVDGVLFDKSTNLLIQLPGGKTGNYAIPDSVTSINDSAFWFSSLAGVTIGNNVTSVPDHTFYNCGSLTNITIASNVTSVGTSAFAYCYSLTAISVDALNPVYCSIDGVLFNKSTNTLIQCPQGKTGCYTIPDGVISIGVDALSYCTSLDRVIVPNSITNIGDWAFRCCYGLTNVVIGTNVSSIGSEAFSYCNNLISLTIPSSVTNIGDWAFSYCPDLMSIYFLGNAPILGSDACYKATNSVIYYLPGTADWEAWFGSRPTALWTPLIQTGDTSFGLQTNQFGFNIAWASSMTVVVEACTDLAYAIWSPLQTNTLTSDTLFFTDPEWTNHPARFYRVRWP